MEDSTNTQPAFHGNGRNKRRSQSKIAANSAPVCGVIDDISTFSEKLSGQHTKGYEVEEQQKVEVVESVSDEQNSNSDEVSQSVSETPEREGPEFEEADSQNRTLEVGLKKMPAKHENIAKGAVSYASTATATRSSTETATIKATTAKTAKTLTTAVATTLNVALRNSSRLPKPSNKAQFLRWKLSA